jgi:hypothetical protein
MLVSYVAGMATNFVDSVRAHLKPGSFFSLSVSDSLESEMTPWKERRELFPCLLVISSACASQYFFRLALSGFRQCHHHVQAFGQGCVH